jgi:hypothetical protein
MQKNIASRKFALEILNETIKGINAHWLIQPNQLPAICQTPHDIENAYAKWGNLMLKAPWSSSGRGLQPITKTPVHPKVWEKINSVIAEQGFIMAEPLLNKVHDMAFLFEIKQGCTRFLGTSHFFTNNKGQYAGNWLNGLPPNSESELQQFIDKYTPALIPALIRTLENSLMTGNYEGVFGIDTLIFRDENKKLRINPCLEINTRHTMGMIALAIEQWLGPGKKGVYKMFYHPGTSFAAFKVTMEKTLPLKLINGSYNQGFLALTPANESTQFGAYLLV